MRLTGALLACGLGLLQAASAVKPPKEVLESARGVGIRSFKVMDVLAKALELEKAGHKVCHLEVGQPQSGAPKKVVKAAESFLKGDRLGYTAAIGVDPLRKRISKHYAEKYTQVNEAGETVPLQVAHDRVIITTGSSGAFLLSFLGLFDAGDVVCVASSGYPCYRNILSSLGCEVHSVPVNSEFKVTAHELDVARKQLWRSKKKKIKGIILSSPSNPTGALLSSEEIKGLCEYCDKEGITFISDEIYHGITYGKKEASALAYSDNVVVINSFSKYYSMTGWRLGWVVAPKSLVPALNRLQQNYFISAPTLSQMAAVQAFECDAELNQHVKRYAKNRAILLKGLADMGFNKVAPADGAFYIYVDTSDVLEDAVQFCKDLLEQAYVACTPGSDFEDPATDMGQKRLRLSYCGATEDVSEAMRRMKTFLQKYPGRKHGR